MVPYNLPKSHLEPFSPGGGGNPPPWLLDYKEAVSPPWDIWAVLNKTPFLKGLEDTFVKGP